MKPRYKIGMRTIKTVVAVGICLLVFQFILVSKSINGIQAALAATICMKSSLQNTLRTGLDRAAGTVVGSIMGILFLLLSSLIPDYLISAIGIFGVLLIIWLCNVLRLQASVTISIVVFLIILIGDSDIPPVYYGLARLGETVFGIFVAYIINRFLDVRRFKKTSLPDESSELFDGIRESTDSDIGNIMQIWLSANIAAHPFLDESHWHHTYDALRSVIKASAHTAVFIEKGRVCGFISLSSDAEIISVCVSKESQHMGYGIRLIDYAKQVYPCLRIRCFMRNEITVKFLLNRGFVPAEETVNANTALTEYVMEWSAKNKSNECLIPGGTV